jgi:anti-anti-sigma factor
MDARQWLDHQRMRFGLDDLGVGVSVHDADGKLIHVNRSGRALLGWGEVAEMSLAEMSSRLDASGTTGSSAEGAEWPVAQVLAGRDDVDAELSIRLPTGMRRPLRVIARAVRDDSARLVGATQTFVDYGDAATARGTVRDLVEQSTPVLNVGERLLLQPLIGTLDSHRASLAMEKLLEAIGTTGARVAIVDITGVSAVDTATANHLLRSLTAARLLGCEVLLSGVSPPIARTITVLGLDLSALRTKRDVAAAIAFGRRRVEASETLSPSEPSADGAESDAPAMHAEKPAPRVS